MPGGVAIDGSRYCLSLSCPQLQQMSNDCGFSSLQWGQIHGAPFALLSIVEIVSTTMRRAAS
jgi:hypothetical protein